MPAAPQTPAGVPSSIEPFDPFRPDFRADPYPVYRRYREQAPVNRGIAAIPGFPGCWYFFRYRDVEAGLKDPRFGREWRRLVPPEALPPVPEAHRPFVQVAGNFMLFRDPPTHTRLRSLVSRAFTPRMVEGGGRASRRSPTNCSTPSSPAARWTSSPITPSPYRSW